MRTRVSCVVVTLAVDRIGKGIRTAPRDELVLHYQPKIDLATGNADCVEALVRWQHPERGLLLPANFLAVAVNVSARKLTSLAFADEVAQLLHDVGMPPERLQTEATTSASGTRACRSCASSRSPR